MVERRKAVELLAIGIGHDVTRYYERAVTITDAEQLAGAITEQLAGLFDSDPRARARVMGMKRGELTRQARRLPMTARPMFAGASSALSAMLAAVAMLAWAMPTGNVAGPLARVLEGYAPWLLGAALVPALLCAGLGARRTGAALTLLIAAGGVLQVRDYREVTRPLDPAREADLSVLFFNALAGNDANGARIVEVAIGTGADILVFAEAEALVGERDALSDTYEFVSPCTDEACALLIATNLPVIRSWRLDLNPAWDGRYAVTEVEVPDHGPVFIAAAHLAKPWMSGIAEPELAQMTAQLNWLTGPSVVVGDFNMPPVEPADARDSGRNRFSRHSRRACDMAGIRARPHAASHRPCAHPRGGRGHLGRTLRRGAGVQPSGADRRDLPALDPGARRGGNPQGRFHLDHGRGEN